MTVIVAVKCTDGAVIGADSKATSVAGISPLIQIQSHEKVRLIGDRVLFAGTGDVGLGQRFTTHIDNAWTSKNFQKSCMDCCVDISTMACTDFQKSGTPRTVQNGFGFGGVLVAPFENNAEVVEFSVAALQPEQKVAPIHFVSMGSGQSLADPFLAFVNKVLWKGASPTVSDGLLGVYWTLMHTVEFAPGGVGRPLQFGVLRREKGQWKAETSNETELGQVGEHVTEIEKAITNTRVIEEADTTKPPKPNT